MQNSEPSELSCGGLCELLYKVALLAALSNQVRLQSKEHVVKECCERILVRFSVTKGRGGQPYSGTSMTRIVMMRRQGGKSVTGAERICERMRSAVHPTYMSTLHTVAYTILCPLCTQ